MPPRGVGRLELCLDAVRLVLSASERETAAAQAATADTQAHIMGKGSLYLDVFCDVCGF